MRLYNTLSRQEEEFAPSRDNTCACTRAVSPSTAAATSATSARSSASTCCGGRSSTIWGYDVHQVMNFTDVDDRTIAGAQKAGMPLREYTDQYIDAFQGRRARAGARDGRGDAPRDRRGEPARDGRDDSRRSSATATRIAATDRSISGSRRFPEYGKLARLDHEGIKPARASTPTTTRRRTRATSCCGRPPKPGEPTWDFGDRPGPPGLAHRVLGDGAAAAGRAADRHPRRRRRSDLPAPRERDRAERGRDGRPFSRFWVHVEHLLVDEQKMSKSLGNVYNVPDVVDAGLPRRRRCAICCCRSHYRKQLKFTLGQPASGRRGAAAAHRFPRAARDGDAPRRAPRGAGAGRPRRATAFAAALRERSQHRGRRSACSSIWCVL